MADPLVLQFGEVSVEIESRDPVILSRLGGHFRHCLPAQADSPAVIFHINRESDDTFELWKGEALAGHALSADRLFWRLMQEAVGSLIAHSCGQAVFHAGGVARDNRGIILCGDSGSGKSTLTAQLVSSGFDYLTDEIVALRLEDEALSGLPRPVVLKGSSGLSWKEKWASEGRETPETFSTGETWIDPELFRGGGICRSARPRILIFPRYQTGQPFRVQPLSQAQAAFMILQRLVNARNLPGHGFPFITSLSKKIRTYQVVYNEITREMMHWVDEILVSDSEP
jgi:hypothetical protein